MFSLLAFTGAGAEGFVPDVNPSALDTAKVVDVEEVVVVASPKENIKLRKQPVSVTLFSGEGLDNLGVTSVKDLTGFVHNLYIPDYGSRLTSSVYIRGIGSRMNTPAVGMYVDNMPYIDKSAYDFTFLDIDRIDVLNGPQGTLYGRNSMGGLFRVFTSDPLRKQGTVAVVGPLADSRANMHGTWSVSAKLDACPSLVEGLRELTKGQVEILYAKGSNLMDDPAYEHRATLFGRSLHRDNRTAQQLLDEALATAAKADVIVAALGESSEMNGECACRTDLGLPDAQRRLLEALLKTGKPVVLTLFTGRPLTLQWEHANVPAILCVWFGGSETAYAVGDVLFGDVNPSGKLTMTFPKNVGQIPLFYNHKNTGRPITAKQWFTKYRSNYIDVDNDPLYPFGYGLSYTTFHYGNIRLDKTTIAPGEALTATVTLTNAGDRDGAEVVQLYIRDRVGSVTRPVKELKGFRKVFLKAGESRDVSFAITEELLKFYDYDLNHVAEPGDFDVMIGGDSHNVKSARFTLR